MAGETPRTLPACLHELLARLLPEDRPGYAAIRRRIEPLVVLGLGRWGEGDLVLGAPGQEIDLEAPMEPVAALGGATLRGPRGTAELTVTVHDADDEGRVEMHIGGVDVELLDEYTIESAWTLSSWSPGDPAPQCDERPREIVVDDAGELTLALSPARRQLWLHDRVDGTNRLVPVTNFYNELMHELGERSPEIALDHRRLFTAGGTFAESSIRAAFRRYNVAFRKVSPERLAPRSDEDASRQGRTGRLARWFQRTGRNNGRS